MLLPLLLALAPQTSQTVTDIQARINKTPFVVSLSLSEWEEDRTHAADLGDKLLFAGSLAPEGSFLTVIVEPNVPLASPQTWRERIAPPGKPFDVGAWPCIDATQELAPDMVQADFHAYVSTRTHALDIHFSRLGDAKSPSPRPEFERIVRSLCIRLLRRGWDEDYPAEIAGPMTVASVLGVDQKQWKEHYLAERAQEWPVHFANAEFLHYLQVPLEEQLAAYDKALALVAKVEKPDAKLRFATAMLHEGKSLALYDAKRYDDSIAPLEKARTILTELDRKERAAMSYNLACSHALAKHKAPALVALKQAIEVDPRYIASAASDTDFASLKDDAEFKALIAALPPAKSPPKK